jgi:hypothetical protein
VHNGTTILIVDQNPPFALGIADCWAVLKLGRIEDAWDIASNGSPARQPSWAWTLPSWDIGSTMNRVSSHVEPESQLPAGVPR